MRTCGRSQARHRGDDRRVRGTKTGRTEFDYGTFSKFLESTRQQGVDLGEGTPDSARGATDSKMSSESHQEREGFCDFEYGTYVHPKELTAGR